MMTRETWQTRFARAFTASGLTVLSLSQRSGVRRQTISWWLAGKVASPRADHLESAAAAMGVTMEDLLAGKAPAPVPHTYEQETASCQTTVDEQPLRCE